MPKRRRGPGPSSDVPLDFSPTPDPLAANGTEEPGTAAVPAVAPAERAAVNDAPRRVHFVVVTTRPAPAADPAEAPLFLTRFWHPRDRRWCEQRFASLEHALHLFVDERGWVLRQQQALDGPDRYELIFEAPRATFAQASGAELLEDEVGLSPRDVAEMVERVEDQVAGEEE
jgi:hypothetical protein